MAQELLRPKTKKLNYRKSGAAAADKLRKREEAEARQAAYAKVPMAQKIDQAGEKEKKKLLAKQSGVQK